MKKQLVKVLVIVGPTASGKSDLAVELALKLNGEVISADSRQVYKGLDIGTGKITSAEMKSVPHHLLDITDPYDRFTVNQWKIAAQKAIENIVSRRKLPIICGGTGYYIDALINDLEFPEIQENDEERRDLESKSLEELSSILKKLDPNRLNQLEKNGGVTNPRRLIRAIQIARSLGAVPVQSNKKEPAYEATWIGLMPPDDVIKARIHARLIQRLNNGMVEEVIRLNTKAPEGASVTHARLQELGLEYRYISDFLQNKLTREELIFMLDTRIWQYARRQKTWWRRNKAIRWFTGPFRPELLDEIVSNVKENTFQNR